MGGTALSNHPTTRTQRSPRSPPSRRRWARRTRRRWTTATGARPRWRRALAEASSPTARRAARLTTRGGRSASRRNRTRRRSRPGCASVLRGRGQGTRPWLWYSGHVHHRFVLFDRLLERGGRRDWRLRRRCGILYGEERCPMDRSHNPQIGDDGFPPPLTAERLQRAREQVAAIREAIHRRGVDRAQLPDPVEELSKARAAAGWE